jgi:hypothetical protein
MGINDFVFALHIHGLRHPTNPESTKAIILSTGKLPGLEDILPAFDPATTEVHPILDRESLSGYNWSSDPRRVIGSGGQCVVKISDLKGEWGPQLIKTQNSVSWDIEQSIISSALTTITVKGKTGVPPTDGSIYWIEGEAVLVAIGSTTASGATLTLTRGVCGSRAIRHRLDPLKYKPVGAETGVAERMRLDSRPDFTAHTFTAELFLFRLDQFGAVSSQYLSRYCYVEGSPSPQKGRKWEIRLSDIGNLLAKHKYGSKERTVSMSHAIRVTQYEPITQSDDAGLGIPKYVQFVLTRLEAEYFFREPVHHCGLGVPDETLTNELGSLILGTDDIYVWFAEVEASGKWLFEIGGPVYREILPADSSQIASIPRPYVTFVGTLVDREAGNGVLRVGSSTFEVQGPQKDGWAMQAATRIRPGEAAPKITLRCVLLSPPIEAFLALVSNDDGNLVGRLSPEIPIEWLNIGTPAVSVPLINPGTTELSERAQLLTTPYYYPLQMGSDRSLGDFLATDLCLPHALLLGPTATTGKLTLRPWARPQESNPVTLPTQSDIEVEPGTRLPRISQLRLSSGFRALTLEPTDLRDVRTNDARATDEAQPVRIWQAGDQLSTEALTTGSLSLLVAGFLDLYGGAPVVYEVPTSIHWILEHQIEFLDFVSWSNNDVLSENGTGVSGVFLLLGFSIEWRTGRVIARIVKDTYEESEVVTTTPATAPSFKPPAIRPTGNPVQTAANTYRVPVQTVGAPGQDIGTLSAGIGSILVGSKVRVVSMAQGRSSNLTQEREGLLEAYGEVLSQTFEPGSKQNYLEIEFDNSWNRGESNFVKQQILVPGESVILLPDERPAASNLEGADIQPTANQLYNGGTGQNMVKVSGSKSFDRTQQRIKGV